MILFVDDEAFRMENDIEELRFRGYEVHLARTADEAVEFLQSNWRGVSGVICDVMMPHGSRFTEEETRGGLRTGVSFFQWTRARWPNIPFVIFTNVSNEALRQQLEREPKCIYIEKRDFLGDAFTDQVQKLIPLRNEDNKH
jgi:CheY-like chemotaxis protein